MALEERKVLLIGMPSTGKTTFLAALQQYFEGTSPSKKITQFKYSPDAAYLNSIHSRWLNCEQQIRTNHDTNSKKESQIFLELVSTKERLVLSVPDTAGEAFKQHWELRIWDESYNKLVQDTSGLLFFIHAEKIKPHVLISDINLILKSDFMEDHPQSKGKDQVEESKEKDQAEEKIATWNHLNTPTQVIAVDLLQFHVDHLKKIRPIPLVIVKILEKMCLKN
jgi:hypothetical protein